ncbi:hypothetical protein I3843_16G049700 [Carya illinoinensis]|nr:hypothetical protein I3843_16G049700 [Carya illinoinensis]
MEALELMRRAANDSLHALTIMTQRVLMQILMRFIRPTDTSLYLPHELPHHAVVVAFLSCVVFISLDNMIGSILDALTIMTQRVLMQILMRFIRPTDTSLYLPHELPHHAVVVAFLSCVVFISLDNMIGSILDDDDIHVWWYLHLCLFGFFYLFMLPWVQFISRPLIGKPSYASFNMWYVSWLLIAAVDHSVGEYMRMNPSLFLTIFALSILCLLLFHTIFYGFRYIFSREVRKWPEIYWTMLQISAAVSIACCIFLSNCKQRPREARTFRDQVYSYLIVPDVGSEINNHHYPKVRTGQPFIKFLLVLFLFYFIENFMKNSNTEK